MIRWYISPYAGTGTTIDPFHAKCWDYTDPAQNQCSGTRSPQRRHYIVRVDAPQAIHDAIMTNDGGTIISPLYADAAAEAAALDSVFDSAPEKTAVDGQGYSTTWMNGSNTLRDMLRYVTRVMHLAQRLSRYDLAERLFTLGLSSTVGDLTPQQRTAVRNWMTDKGLATGWITNGTTLRQVLHFIVTNIGMGRLRIGPVEL